MDAAPPFSLDLTGIKALIGQDLPQPEQFNYSVTADGIRNFAYAIPDPNALYLDDDFAESTRWRGIIAPPGYLYAHGSPAWLCKLDGIKDAQGKEIKQSDNATEVWHFYKPVRPGDTILSYGKLVGATPKTSRSLGEAVLVEAEMRFTNQKGQKVARLNSFCFRFNPGPVTENGGVGDRYPPLAPGQFTRNVPTPPALPGTFPTPARRIDPDRLFDDIRVGEEIPTLELGPIMASDMGKFNALTLGTGFDRIGAHGHIPDAFAPGPMRTPWFGSLLSRWAGPNAFVTKIAQRNEYFVLVGFRLLLGGTVTARRVEDGRCLVDLTIWCRSELGFQTNSGTAQVEFWAPRHG